MMPSGKKLLSPERKLLPRFAESLRQANFEKRQSHYRDTLIYEIPGKPAKMVSSPIREAEGYVTQALSHSVQDARIHELILDRVPLLVRDKRICVVPSTYQYNPNGVVNRWSVLKKGKSLDEVLKRASKETNMKCYRDVMRQLGYMHTQAQVTHQDIERQGGTNLILWDGKRPYFTDFGVGTDLREVGIMSPKSKEQMLYDVDSAARLFQTYVSRTSLDPGFKAYCAVLRRTNPDLYTKMRKHLNASEWSKRQSGQ